MMKRKGLGKGQGMGYKNLAPMDSHVHSLSAKGVKTMSIYDSLHKVGDDSLKVNIQKRMENDLDKKCYKKVQKIMSDEIHEWDESGRDEMWKGILGAKGKNIDYSDAIIPDPVPDRNFVTKENVVDFIMSYEDGRLSQEGVLELFSYLIKSGDAWTLQGHYGRMATNLIKLDLLTKEGDLTKKGSAIFTSDARGQMFTMYGEKWAVKKKGKDTVVLRNKKGGTLTITREEYEEYKPKVVPFGDVLEEII